MAIIDKSTDYFRIKLYSGNNNIQSIVWDETDTNMKPDMLWIKSYAGNTVFEHVLGNIVSGANTYTVSNSTAAEASNSNVIRAFNTNGFEVGGATQVSEGGRSYVAWGWKASNTTATNTAGSINSTVSVNAEAGFSVVGYTGNGTGNITIGHGLGATPTFIIVKNRTTAQAWGTLSPSFVSASEPRVLYLNATSSYANDTNVWGTSAAFNNNTFTVGDWNGSNQSSSNFIAYCFANVPSFSKFGLYTGNGSSDGPFVYTGFKPAFVMVKKSAGTGNWFMKDTARDPGNPAESTLAANSASSAAGWGTSDSLDLLSNGFKMRDDTANINTNGDTYIYVSFAENPFVTSTDNNSIPATAR